MSTMANERNTTAEGLIKHIMAHEAHKGIDDRLLALRKEDNAVDVSVIYNKEDLHASLTGVSALGLTTNGTKGNYTSFDFASKFKVSVGGVGKSSSKSSAGGSGVRFSSMNSSGSSSAAMSTGSTTKKFFSMGSKDVSKSSSHSIKRYSGVASRHSSCGSIAEESTAEITPETTP